MKLKYYLRGLGIGMLVAALVLILSGNTGAQMDDEAVKRRAAQLGMVEKDKSVLGDIDSEAAADEEKETDIQERSSGAEVLHVEVEDAEESSEAGSEEDETEESTEADSEKDEAQQAGESEPEENAAEPETSENEADSEEQALVQEIEQRADEAAGRAEEAADRGEEAAQNPVPGSIVTLSVRSGDSSVSVARKAADAGLVQSAADFDVFLCQNGYDKRISIGNYEIPMGASEKEIAEIVTKSR